MREGKYYGLRRLYITGFSDVLSADISLFTFITLKNTMQGALAYNTVSPVLYSSLV